MKRQRSLKIRVWGGGVSALAVATLLCARGADVRLSLRPCGRGRIVAIPAETLDLICDLLGVCASSLRIGPMVNHRRVDWSNGTQGVVPHPALVCDLADLAAVLTARLRDAGCVDFEETDAMPDDDADWVLHASGRPPPAPSNGVRVGQFIRVATISSFPQIAIAATLSGWIFTAPHPEGGMAVLLVSPSAALCATKTEDVSARLASIGLRVSPGKIMEIGKPECLAPALAEPLFKGNQLRVGDAAFALDPLRGDGVGFALKGALLAQAVLARIDEGSSPVESLRHYEARLRRAFVTHLCACREHYQRARHAEIWSPELAVMDSIIRARRTDAGGHLALRIEGRDLVAAAGR